MKVFHVDKPGEYRAEMLSALKEALAAFNR